MIPVIIGVGLVTGAAGAVIGKAAAQKTNPVKDRRAAVAGGAGTGCFVFAACGDFELAVRVSRLVANVLSPAADSAEIAVENDDCCKSDFL